MTDKPDNQKGIKSTSGKLNRMILARRKKVVPSESADFKRFAKEEYGITSGRQLKKLRKQMARENKEAAK